MKTIHNELNNRGYEGAGTSCYYGNEFRQYATHQWNIKYYGFQSDAELEYAQLYVFGSDFEVLKELTGIDAEFSIEGRSGGWLTSNSELTIPELQKITEYVRGCLRELPEVLKEYRIELREGN